MLDTIRKVNELPIDTVKMHQLQLIRGTKMARQAEAGEVVIKQFTVDEYIDLCVKVVALVRKGIYIEICVAISRRVPDFSALGSEKLRIYQQVE